MTIVAPGTCIGPYDVTSVLGVGGMGVVFRARDAKLQRDVALKFLPEHLAADPERLSRFHREAQVLASLNHPNIAQIYGFEESGGPGCIVMELVEGDTLADRVKRGRPLPIDEAIRIATQIADALEAAHERGVMHRDLKPANIKIAPAGQVKVLDFGLAKVFGKVEPEFDPSDSPTLMSESTPGMILGTAAYMSPEQARGKSVDARTDVWAFACVVYEMLTGRKAFEGETATDSIAKILAGQPDWTALPAATPPSIRLLLSTALNKNPKQRFQHIRDARLLLQASTDEALELVAVAPAAPRRTWWIAALLALALGGALIPASLYFMRPAENSSVTRFVVNAPDGTTFSVFGEAAISPDGRKLAFIAYGSSGPRLWVQALDAAAPQAIPGTEQANVPFWSPDSREVAFFAQGKLKKVNVSGGQPELICAATSLNPGVWSSNGTILFSGATSALYTVSASGGTPLAVTTLDPARKDINHVPVAWLPDGRQFLYTAFSGMADTPPQLIVGTVDSKNSKAISAGSGGSSFRNSVGLISQAEYVDRYVLALRNGALVAQEFDPSGLALHSDASRVVDQASSFSVSANGVLVYTPMIGESKFRVASVDRQGRKTELKDIEADDYREIELSPDGKRLALEKNFQNIWLHDLVRGITNKSTFAIGSNGLRWSPDGEFVVFSDTTQGIQRKPANGGEAQLLVNQQDALPNDWSTDGHSILYSRLSKQTDLWIASLEGQEWKAKPFVATDADERNGQFSPNGRWVAYASDESAGRYEIYVRSRSPQLSGKIQISKNGGVQPRWRRDGRELFFLSLDGTIMRVRFEDEDGPVEWGAPEALFDTGTGPMGANGAPVYNYAVTPDGQHFYVKVPIQTATAPNRLHVILNWPALLKERKN